MLQPVTTIRNAASGGGGQKFHIDAMKFAHAERRLMDGLFCSLSFFMFLTLRLVKRFVQKKWRGKAARLRRSIADLPAQGARGLAHSKTLRVYLVGRPVLCPPHGCAPKFGSHGVTSPTDRASVLECGGPPPLMTSRRAFLWLALRAQPRADFLRLCFGGKSVTFRPCGN